MAENSLLLTDLYELSMLEAYAAYDMADVAVFELFVRKLPEQRGFLLAAGLAQAVQFLEQMHFTEDELAWLATSGGFSTAFVAQPGHAALHRGRGRAAGRHGVLPRRTGAARHRAAAAGAAGGDTADQPDALPDGDRLQGGAHGAGGTGRQLVDFGLRRAHGAEAGLLAARAGYLAGFDATATVQAGREFGIPLVGTMAHSFIQAHDDEATAFARFAQVRPQALTLLIDTYDTEHGAAVAASLARRLAARGH